MKRISNGWVVLTLAGVLLTSCQAKEQTNEAAGKAGAPSTSGPELKAAPASMMSSTGKTDRAAGPAFSGKDLPTQSNAELEKMQQTMQTRSDVMELSRQLEARKMKVYEDNTTIRELQAKMRELQQQIDDLMAKDEELIRLKKEMAALSTDMPIRPFGGAPSQMPPMMMKPVPAPVAPAK
ncbi:MAG: hypothetical protein HY343_10195 [Lentisphaerae bacterium]|nr:hypothetical protein [Lentisphaerota bacterium]